MGQHRNCAETGFRIERKTGSGGTWAQIATVSANVMSYSNTGLSASTNYYYRVRAYNSIGNSAYSNEASATSSPEGMQGMLGLEDASGTRQQANSVEAIIKQNSRCIACPENRETSFL